MLKLFRESPITTNKIASHFRALRFEDGVWMKTDAKGKITCAANQKNYKGR